MRDPPGRSDLAAFGHCFADAGSSAGSNSTTVAGARIGRSTAGLPSGEPSAS